MIENSFCFLTLGDITAKENRIVGSLLSLFNIDYYNITDIVNDYANKDMLVVLDEIVNFGIKNIIIDIKTGFKVTDESAKEMASEILTFSKEHNVNVTCFITSLNLSMGTSFGKDLEKIEVANLLNGKEYSPLLKLAIKITSLIANKKNNLSLEENQSVVVEHLKQQSEFSYESSNLNLSKRIFSIKSSQTGFIKNINIIEIDDLLNKLGYNDSKVGIVFTKQIGDYVLENEELAKVYLNEKDILASEVLDCFEIANAMGKVEPLVKEIVGYDV